MYTHEDVDITRVTVFIVLTYVLKSLGRGTAIRNIGETVEAFSDVLDLGRTLHGSGERTETRALEAADQLYKSKDYYLITQ